MWTQTQQPSQAGRAYPYNTAFNKNMADSRSQRKNNITVWTLQAASHQPPHPKPTDLWVLSWFCFLFCFYASNEKKRFGGSVKSVRCCWCWCPVFVRAGVFMCIVTVQPVSHSVNDRQGLVLGVGWRGGRQNTEHEAGDGTGQERGAILKGYPPSATLAKGITPCCRLFSISG